MIVIPAIDIRRGKVTQLVQGKPGTEKYYGDPVEIAKCWEKKGAKTLHIIVLDATIGDGKNNFAIVEKIRKATKVPLQFGGGVRDAETACIALDSGIDRVIIGSAAVKDPNLVKALSKEYGKDRIMVAVDSLGGDVVIKGWAEKTGIKTINLIRKFEDNVFGFLVTDVDKEGLMKGIDVDEFRSIADATKARICASGGITTQRDIKALEKIGIWGCVVGKALYEGKISSVWTRSP